MRIAKLLLYVVAAWGLCAACNNGRPGKSQAGDDMSGEWYRRYTGAIAGQPVVVNLHHFDGRMEGSYYYVQKGEVAHLEDADEAADGYSCSLNETNAANDTVHNEGDGYTPSRWAINFRGSAAMGKLVSGDGKSVYGIDIAENYGAGSYRLGVMIHGDSIQEKIRGVNTQAISYYQTLLPGPQMSKGDAAYLLATELHLLGGDTLGAKSLREYIRKEDTKYFTRYKALLKDLTIDERPGHKDDWEYYFAHSRNVFVLYNDSGMLCLDIHDYDHGGGGSGHGIYMGSYACVDMREHKIWRLKDMMNIDAARLQPLLEDELRKIFKINPQDKLSNALTVDAAPLTENVFITGTGIAFCYNPMIISPEADGEICVFLPYTRLSTMLKEDFKRRMCRTDN